MDCKTARLLLEFSRPFTSELPAGEIGALEQHLAACAECAQLARSERAWDDHLAAAMREVSVPAGLRQNVRDRLEAEARRQRRRWLRRPLLGLGAAAAMLLALALGWQWQRAHPPRLDVAQVAENFFSETINPDAEKLDEFFRRGDKTFLAPRDFNYRLFRLGVWNELQGKRVPLLLFTEGQAQARVYFLARTQFNLTALESDVQEIGSGCKAEVRPLADGRGAHLVLYTGESLEPFLLRDDGRAAMAGGEAQ